MKLTGNTLLGEDKIRLEFDNLLAHGLDLLLLNLQDPVPIRILGDLNVRLTLSLLVLQRAIQQDDPRILNSSPHLGMRHVLVDHHTVEHARILNLASWDLLDLGVSLDVDRFGAVLVPRHRSNRLQCKLAHHVAPAGDELGADGGLDEREHFGFVGRIDRNGDGVDDDQGFFESSLEGRYDDDWVDVAFEMR